MFNVGGGGEVLVILLLALIVLGPDKLPNAARQAGKYLSEFRRMSQGFQDELKNAMDLEGLTTTRPRRMEPTTNSSLVPTADAVIDSGPETASGSTFASTAEPSVTPPDVIAPTSNGSSLHDGDAKADAPTSGNGTAPTNPLPVDVRPAAVAAPPDIVVEGPSGSFS